jgi:hypothetical protein
MSGYNPNHPEHSDAGKLLLAMDRGATRRRFRRTWRRRWRGGSSACRRC